MKAFWSTLLFFAQAVVLWAHPHIFIDGRLSLFIKDQYIEKVQVEWILDEITTASFLMDFDLNFDGILSEEEVLPLANNMMHFETNQYYTHLEADGERIDWAPPYNIQITLENQRIVYRFQLSPKKGKTTFKEAYVGLWDASYFSNVQWNPQGSFTIVGGRNLAQEKTKREDFSYMGGQIIPEIYYVKKESDS